MADKKDLAHHAAEVGAELNNSERTNHKIMGIGNTVAGLILAVAPFLASNAKPMDTVKEYAPFEVSGAFGIGTGLGLLAGCRKRTDPENILAEARSRMDRKSSGPER